MFEQAEDHRLLEQDVREALRADGLTLAYQPIVDAKMGRSLGAKPCFAGAIRGAGTFRPTSSSRSSRIVD
jgi:EAL domain-containing protein (putative c-di-GMP-specific phosphodiesterase class I)